MIDRATDYGLEVLLAFDGRIHHLEDGCWIKFEIKRVRATRRRPHRLAYSFTLHAPDGPRLVGSDNAHHVRPRDPQSVAALVEMSGRAQPNLTRTLAKLEAAGLITLKTTGRRKTPSASVKRIMVEIDPYSDHDRLRIA